jgi:hypothetical protein
MLVKSSKMIFQGTLHLLRNKVEHSGNYTYVDHLRRNERNQAMFIGTLFEFFSQYDI